MLIDFRIIYSDLVVQFALTLSSLLKQSWTGVFLLLAVGVCPNGERCGISVCGVSQSMWTQGVSSSISVSDRIDRLVADS